jgi:alkyl sulfatase BDS1-like metallo-beta-lactamase superfamily hydrolase
MSDIYECRIDDDVFQIRVEDGKLDLRLGPAEKPAVVMTTDLETYAVLGMRTLSFAEAIGQGKLRIEGDPEAMARFARIFRPPRPSTAQPTAPTD